MRMILLAGANMAMQVVSSGNAMLSRVAQSVVMAPQAKHLHSCSVPYTDVQSAATRTLITAQVSTGCVVSCSSRYLFPIKHLQKILTGPSAFRMKIQVRDGLP